MKFPRALVFLAGLAGLAAIFMPFLQFDTEVNGKKLRAEVTAFRMVGGVQSVRDVVKGDYEVAADEDKRVVADMNAKLDETRTVYIIAFAPGLVLLLLAIAGRLGRGKATIALIVGLLGLGIWFLLGEGFKKAREENKTGIALEAGIAMTLLLATGAGGTAGGLLGLIAPERRRDAAPPA